MADIEYSVVIPFYNEEDSIKPLYSSLKKTMDSLGGEYEFIFVNDGSTDRTKAIIEEIRGSDRRLVYLETDKRSGQTEALRQGFGRARGGIIISLDGDMQNDPADIAGLIKELKKGYDFVCGWRHQRKDPLSKKIASRFANIVQGSVFKSHLHDISCTLRAYTGDTARAIPLKREGAHRFIPYFLIMKGRKVSEVKVNHRPRAYGKTKYGFSRSFKVAYDFLTLLINRRRWM